MLLAAVCPGIEGEVLLISGAESVSWKDFYRALEDVLGTRSTIDIPAEKLQEMWKKELRDASTLAQIRKAIWNDDIVGQVLRNPAVRGSLKLLKRMIPEDRRRMLKSRVLPSKKGNSDARKGARTHGAKGPIHVPDETLLSLYRPQTRVRIDKARTRLGYEPQFSFERGMDLTAQYLQWANLAPTACPADTKRPADTQNL